MEYTNIPIPVIINNIDTNCAILIFPNINESVLKDSIYNLPIPYHIKYILVNKPLLYFFNTYRKAINITNPNKHHKDS